MTTSAKKTGKVKVLIGCNVGDDRFEPDEEVDAEVFGKSIDWMLDQQILEKVKG